MPDGRDDDLRDESYLASIQSSQTVFAGRIWDVVRDRIKLDEIEFDRDYLKHSGSVAVLAMNGQGEVLLIKQYRHPISKRDWELPAGLRDIAGEPKEATAKRELAEEAGIQASKWTELGQWALSPGSSSEQITIFLAEDVQEVLTDFTPEGEELDIERRWVPIEHAVNAVIEGRIQNAVLVIGVLSAYVRR